MSSVEYVPQAQIPSEGKARVWRHGSRVSTVQVGDTYYKSLHGFGGDAELAAECLELWREREYKGNPTGPASFFHKEFRAPQPKWSTNGALAGRFRGGWMESFESGHVPGPLGYYDVKSAYRWAGLQPMPEKIEQRRRGHDRSLWIMEVDGAPAGVPRRFRPGSVVAVTDRDVELFGISGEPLAGWGWNREDESSRLADALTKDYGLPQRAEKLLTQSYWGRWASQARTWCETWKGGERVKRHALPNRHLNLVWSTLIVNRVLRRAYRAAISDSVLVCVDAVMRTKPLPREMVGDEPGDFRLKEHIGPDGVEIRAPGVWARAPAPSDMGAWDRHAGFPGFDAKDPARLRRVLREKYDVRSARDLFNLQPYLKGTDLARMIRSAREDENATIRVEALAEFDSAVGFRT